MTTNTTSSASTHLSLLRTFAQAVAVLAVAQAVIGLLLLLTDLTWYEVHGWIGYGTFVVALAGWQPSLPLVGAGLLLVAGASVAVRYALQKRRG